MAFAGRWRPHILIRDALRRGSEAERSEILVQPETGDDLGAVHSAEATSVMRPDSCQGQAVARRFQIGFDAPNTLAMYLIAEELRAVASEVLTDPPAETKNVLRCAYASPAAALPADPAAPKYRMLLDFPSP